MIFIKSKLLILILLTTYIFPLGGIGISGIYNSISTNRSESDGDFNLNFESKGLENGLNIFFYFDALPKSLAIEYNREIKAHLGTSIINYELQNLPPLEGDLLILRKSDYLTIRKELMGIAIPILAKASLYIGAGINQHQTVVPSIDLLKNMYNVDNVDDLYNAANQSWDSSSILDLLDNSAIKSTGLHIQGGIQGKFLILNLFANARYTFITNDDNSSIKSFPGLTLGLAYGI